MEPLIDDVVGVVGTDFGEVGTTSSTTRQGALGDATEGRHVLGGALREPLEQRPYVHTGVYEVSDVRLVLRTLGPQLHEDQHLDRYDRNLTGLWQLIAAC